MEFCVKLANRKYDMTIGNNYYSVGPDGFSDDLPFEREQMAPGGWKDWDKFKTDYDKYRLPNNIGKAIFGGGLASGLAASIAHDSPDERLALPLAIGGLGGMIGGTILEKYTDSKMKPYGIKDMPSDVEKAQFASDLAPNLPNGKARRNITDKYLEIGRNLPIVSGDSKYYGQNIKYDVVPEK